MVHKIVIGLPFAWAIAFPKKSTKWPHFSHLKWSIKQGQRESSMANTSVFPRPNRPYSFWIWVLQMKTQLHWTTCEIQNHSASFDLDGPGYYHDEIPPYLYSKLNRRNPLHLSFTSYFFNTALRTTLQWIFWNLIRSSREGLLHLFHAILFIIIQ